jgi:RHS repeat-associated protein
VKDGALWLEVSEGVNAEAFQAALAAGAVTLTDTATSTAVAITATQPVQEGRQAFRRIVLTPGTPPADGTNLELRIEPAALRDAFGNPLAVAYVQTFPWPSADQVLDDTAAPEIQAVRLVGRLVELELTEEPDLATVTSAVTVDGQGLTWTLTADRYTVRSTDALAAGAATLTVATTLADLAGTTLAQALTEPVPAAEQDASLFEAPEPRESFASTIGNRAGFHGLDHDGTTGMLYVRNRWLDPELARWTTVDPMGFADGPSGYQAFLNNPTTHSDPLGLRVRSGPNGLHLVQETLGRMGRHDLAQTLILEGGEIRIVGKAIFPSWIPSARQDKVVKLLFKVITDHRLDYELIVERNPRLARASGGLHPEPKIRNGIYISTIELDPDIINRTRLRREDGTWVDADVSATLVHEFAHAWFTMDKRLTSTMRGPYNVGPTDKEAVEYEDIYRRDVGLPSRGSHDISVYCPSGDWNSLECRIRLWCGPREVKSDSNECRIQWLEYMINRWRSPLYQRPPRKPSP